MHGAVDIQVHILMRKRNGLFKFSKLTPRTHFVCNCFLNSLFNNRYEAFIEDYKGTWFLYDDKSYKMRDHWSLSWNACKQKE